MTPNPYIRLYTTQLGMDITSSWKSFKRYHREGCDIPSSTEFSHITAYEMIKEVDRIKAIEDDVPNRARVVDIAPSKESITLSLSFPFPSHVKHTMVLLEGKKQVRCVWCSKVNLVQQKVSMICKECTKGFFRATSGRECWSHHVAINELPKNLKKGTKQMQPSEMED